MDCHFEGPLTETLAYHGTRKEATKRGRSLVTIDMLPDVALLEIFDFYLCEATIEAWHKLVHVCRNWRNLIFESPSRLNLRLFCTERTPVRETLNVWPLLPIVLRGDGEEGWGDEDSEEEWGNGEEERLVDNIIAALEHSDRVCDLKLVGFPISQLEKVLVAIHQPFPELTSLVFQPGHETRLIDPDSFLGGSAPLLQTLILCRISFPGLPKLLLSATRLVRLELWAIPDSGYISPEAMVTCLSMLTRLESLEIGFESPRRRPDRRPPPPTRTLLPVLTWLRFNGVSEYLEGLVACIDAPFLFKLKIAFFHQLILDTPQLSQFISRTPKFRAPNEAYLIFSDRDVRVSLPCELPPTFDGRLELGITCGQSDWQLSSLTQVCDSSFLQAFIPAIQCLYISKDTIAPRSLDDTESGQWLELLHPFTVVRSLYLSRDFAPRIGPALEELVRERVTEVLPALQSLFLEVPFRQETVEQFVAARQLAGHPIAVSRWKQTEYEYSFESELE